MYSYGNSPFKKKKEKKHGGISIEVAYIGKQYCNELKGRDATAFRKNADLFGYQTGDFAVR